MAETTPGTSTPPAPGGDAGRSGKHSAGLPSAAEGTGVPAATRRHHGPVDLGLLEVYMDDHLAGAVAGARRMRHTADRLERTPVGAAMDRVAREVAAERDELREIAHGLGLGESRTKELATRVAELVARLKANGRWTRPSPMAPLLEVELLRGAVTGKLGIWQTLHDLAEPLGLDAERMAEMVEQSRRQIDTLHEVHAWVRSRALKDRSAGSTER